jgi:multidrug resistance protein MdtO
VQYLARTPLSELPGPIGQAGIEFETDVAQVMRAMASEVSEKPVQTAPDIRLSADNFRREVRKYYQDLGLPVSPQASDLSGLTESLASVLAPLYEDIHSTVAVPSRIAQVQSRLLRDAAPP